MGRGFNIMKEKPDQTAPSCAHAEELVTYLYGEASRQEAAQFRLHLEQCGSCAEELAAFGSVREDVIEWRNQSLPSTDFQQASAPLYSKADAALQKPSALAAFRQFFTLAPLWMRAATAVAVLVICAIVAFTVIHFSEQPRQTVQVTAQAPAQAQPDEAARARADEINQKAAGEAKETQATVVEEERPVQIVKERTAAPRRKPGRPVATDLTASRQRQSAPGKVRASQEARQQLAELVQTSRDDDDLPRLSDLIDDTSGPN